MNASIRELVERYKTLGIRKGNEFLMAPIVAMSLLDDLAKLNIKVMLCDSWRYIKTEDGIGIIEIVGGGTGFDNFQVLTAKKMAEEIKRFLNDGLPSDADLVSFLLEDTAIDSLFWH